jgi:hypothetical protein
MLGEPGVSSVWQATVTIISDIVCGLRNQHRRFLNWIDAFWGYDVFIAHRRADASEYALKLYEALKAQRIACFIDRAVYGPGDSLAVATQRHVHKSTLFVLLGSPEILSSRKPLELGGGGGQRVPRVPWVRPENHSDRFWRDNREGCARNKLDSEAGSELCPDS